jgi:hypothetical protein
LISESDSRGQLGEVGLAFGELIKGGGDLQGDPIGTDRAPGGSPDDALQRTSSTRRVGVSITMRPESTASRQRRAPTAQDRSRHGGLGPVTLASRPSH